MIRNDSIIHHFTSLRKEITASSKNYVSLDKTKNNMENLNTNFGEEPKIDGFIITESSKVYLAETAKWANFLAILGFIFIAIIVILAFGMGAVMA